MPELTREVILAIVVKRRSVTVQELLDALSIRGISASKTSNLSPLIHDLAIDGLVEVGDTRVDGAYHVMISLPAVSHEEEPPKKRRKRH